LDPNITAATFISACRDIIIEITGVSFVDDSSLAVTSDYQYDPSLTDAVNKWKEVEHLVTRLSALGQHWERLLFSTGGGHQLPEKSLVLNALVVETRHSSIGHS
jgi:hypothetical protein